MATIEERTAKLESFVEVLANHVVRTHETILQGLEKVDENFVILHKNFEKVDENFSKIEKSIHSLKGNTSDGFQSVSSKLEDLKSEIKKINEVTRYEDEYANFLSIAHKRSEISER